MEIKLKRVPFNIELAKKITEGKINGAKIIDGLNRSVRILNFNIKGDFPIAAVITLEDASEGVYSFTKEGTFFVYPRGEKDLQILVPVHYKNYSNFVPQKWQPCLVRDFDTDKWIARVATGNKECNGFYVLAVHGEIQFFCHCLPISKKTIQLLGTTKSYEQLLEEEWTNEE